MSSGLHNTSGYCCAWCTSVSQQQSLDQAQDAVNTAAATASHALALQIFAVGRQALSLVAGGAIDVFLLGQLRMLRQEHTLARAISAIQTALWPGGTWFMYRPEYPRSKVLSALVLQLVKGLRLSFFWATHSTPGTQIA